MIKVKALRPTQIPTASPEENYRKTDVEPTPSRWPAALAVFVLAVAGYLRSLVSAEANPPAAQPEEELDASRQHTAEDQTEKDVEETGALAEKKGDNDKDVALGSGSAGGAAPGLADYLNIDSPPIDYDQLPLPAFSPATFEFGLGRVSNDNGFALAFQMGGSLLPAFQSDSSGFQAQLPIVMAPFKPTIVLPTSRDDEPVDDRPEPETTPSRNRAPRLAGTVQLGPIGPCQTLMLTLAGLLMGASDADGDTLMIRNLQVSSGTITLGEGGWQYRPMAGYFGPVTVSYGVSDGIAAIDQTATFSVVEVLVLDGTPGDDLLTGTECRDLISGGDGNDVIDALGSNDTVHGGAGHDLIFSGAGDDTVYGGSGNDVIYSGAGNDRVYGEDGDDRLFGESGDDLLVGGAGNDELSGGDGNDTLQGEAGDDMMSGGAGDDNASGGDGKDLIDGGSGNDTLQGDAGNDHIIGGAGDDVIAGGDGDDIIEAGDGDDVVDGGTGNNIISTGSGQNRVSAAGGDNVVIGGSGIDLVQLGAGRDVARLGGSNDIVASGSGDDRLFGEDGDDMLAGEAGDDLLDGGEGNDTLLGGAGDDTVLAGEDDDIIDAGDGDDEIDAGAGDDVVHAGEGDDEVDGGDGNDLILAGDGDDKVEAGKDDDIVLSGAGDDEVKGEDGDDILDGGEGDDYLIGGAGDDALMGAQGDDVIEGGSGDDMLDGGEGSDIVGAGSGDDVVIVALDAEDDCLDGSSGRDTLDLSLTKAGVTVDLTKSRAVGIEIGEDTVLHFEALIGGDGDDIFIVGRQGTTITGGAGEDRFEFDVSDQDCPPGQTGESGQNSQDLIHQILDLQEGDRIVVKQYEIHSDASAGGTQIDPFNQIYGDQDEDRRPFRFRIEKVGENERTYVDVFVNQAENEDFSIEIYGHHKLYYC